MAYSIQTVSDGQVITSAWGNAVQQQYAEAKAELQKVNGDIDLHPSNYMYLNAYGSSPDGDGNYTHMDYKNGSTMVFDSTVSNPNADGLYQTMVLNFYDATGVSIVFTKTVTFTYDSNGKISSRVVS